MKKLLSFIMILVLILSVFSFSYAKDDKDLKIDLEKKINNQVNSIKAHDKLMKSLEKSKYIDNYAGCFIDDEGFLTIVIAEGDKKLKKVFVDLAELDDVKTIAVKYNLSELLELKENISSQREQLKSKGIIITGTGLSIRENKVRLYVYELIEDKENTLHSIFGDYIIFENSDELFAETDIDITNGKELVVNLRAGTVGFAATRSKYIGGGVYTTVDGIVGTGHFLGMSEGDSAEYDDTYIIGTVTNIVYYNNATCDTSFIELDAGYNGTNDVAYGYSIIGTGTAIENASVVFVGDVSGPKYGTIIDQYHEASYNDGVTILDVFKCDFDTTGGDSGGPIMYPAGGSVPNQGYLIGTLTGSSIDGSPNPYSMYSKIGNIKSSLGLTSIKTN